MKCVHCSLLLISFHAVLILGNEQKCCRSGEHIVEKNSEFTCEKLVNPRLQENFEHTDFLSGNVTGSCLEILSEKDVAKFSVDAEGKIVKLSGHEDLYFPKCCPLDYRYNATTHGCEKEAGNFLDILEKNSFIRVGLPKCKIISDQILDSIQDVKMNGKELILLKESKILRKDFCVDSTLDGKLAVRKCEDDMGICSRIRCIHKCCPDGQSFINRSRCYDTFVHGLDLHFSETIHEPNEPFVIIHGHVEKIYPLYENEYGYYLDKFGTFTHYINMTQSFQYIHSTDDGYCIEYVFRNKNYKVVTMDGYFMFAGGKKQPIETKFLVTRLVKIISCIFLVLTISVYLLLPKMRNLFGKILLSYCVSTFIFFFVLVISQFYSEDFSDGVCKFIGFISVLASIWSFTWLHIMCIDIWISFGTPRTLSGPLQKNELKRLLVYSLYGWGYPLLWVLMIAIFSVTTMMPEAIRPIVGERKCYLENSDGHPGNYAYHLYVIAPLLIQQVINTTLFVKTILYCLKIKAEVARMNDSEKRTSLNASKERLGLIMKLAVIMGVLFIFETVSSIYNFRANEVTKYIEVIWDSINCLQGVFIFIIFICKKKVFYAIGEKILVLKSRKTSLSSNATTHVSMHNITGVKTEKAP